MQTGAYLLTVIVSYLMGSLPTGFLVAKARGIDIRSVGSGNIGATNVFRILGKQAGMFVLAVDALKGALACLFVPSLALHAVGVSPGGQPSYLSLTAGVAAILGHNYTCWLKFKGGKGIATTAGVLFALAPAAASTILAVWIVVFALSRYVSLASIAAAVALPFASWYWHDSKVLTYTFIGLSVLAIYKHKGNIRRLLQGTESRIGSKSKVKEDKSTT